MKYVYIILIHTQVHKWIFCLVREESEVLANGSDDDILQQIRPKVPFS
jgi:hypothetical protein